AGLLSRSVSSTLGAEAGRAVEIAQEQQRPRDWWFSIDPAVCLSALHGNGHVLGERVAEHLVAAKQLAVISTACEEEEIVVEVKDDAPDVLHHDTHTWAVCDLLVA